MQLQHVTTEIDIRHACLRRNDIPFRIVGDYAVLHKRADKIVLNRSAMTIISKLDGLHTAAQVCRAAADLLQISDYERFERDSLRLMARMYALGIISDPTGSITQIARDRTMRATRAISGGGCATPPPPVSPKLSSLEDQLEAYYWRHHLIYKMYLELTYRCNFRCSHCYNPTHINVGEMSTRQWIDVLAQLAELGCYLIALTGGEPFARADIDELLLAAAEKGFSVRINTNASLITPRHIDTLVQIGDHLQDVYVSFYGGSPETSDQISSRPGGFAASLTAATNMNDAGIPVLAKFVTMRDNVREAEMFEVLMSAASIPHTVITETINPKTNRDASSLVQIVPAHLFAPMIARRGIAPRQTLHEESCKPGHIRGAISPKGDVSPCEWLTDFKLGNVTQVPLGEVWYGDKFLQFRQQFMENQEECTACHLHSSCGRCPAHSYLETGSLFKCAPNHRRDAEYIYANSSVPSPDRSSEGEQPYASDMR